eukprot:c30717_g1_i1 orf=807-965(+)
MLLNTTRQKRTLRTGDSTYIIESLCDVILCEDSVGSIVDKFQILNKDKAIKF